MKTNIQKSFTKFVMPLYSIFYGEGFSLSVVKW